MRRAVITLITFAIGVGLPFAFGSGMIGGRNSNQPQIDDSSLSKENPGSEEAAINPPPIPELELPPTNLKPLEYREILERALAVGTLESMQVVRPEYFRALAKQSEIQKILKEVALAVALKKFDEGDFRGWRYSLSDGSRVQSKARSFVDNLSALNPQLGKFIETALLLSSELYLSLDKGTSISADEAMKNVMGYADAVFGSRSPLAMNTSDLLEVNILADEVFADFFKSLNARIIGNHLSNKAVDFKRKLALLRSLEGESVSEPSLVNGLEWFFVSLSNNREIKLRDELLGSKRTIERLKVNTAESAALRRAFGSLLAVYVVDKLESGDLVTARSYLNVAEEVGISESIKKLLETQIAFFSNASERAQLKEPGKKATLSKAKQEALALRATGSDVRKANLGKEETGLFEIMAWVVGGLVIVMVAFIGLGLVIFRMQDAKLGQAAKTPQNSDFTLPTPLGNGKVAVNSNFDSSAYSFDDADLQDVDLIGR